MDSEARTPALLERMLLDESAEPMDLPLSLLEKITKNFSNDLIIGSGGSAVVYKGRLGNGRPVAVKKLSNTIYMDEAKYNEEVACLMTVRHENIVRFLGYCADTHGQMWDYEGKFVMADVRHRLLCFEYLHKGSLDCYITDASDGLNWRERYQIIKGICKGLCYLHERRIVHLDLKPANILLDDDMVPKICDFGLSRCFSEEQTRVITSKTSGSMGYMAPEFMEGVITFKSDIYSLGVILRKILTGRKGFLGDHVLEIWRNKLEISLADTRLEQVRVCAEISMHCVEFDPARRPDIQSIIQKLAKTEGTDEYIKSCITTSLVAQSSSVPLQTPQDGQPSFTYTTTIMKEEKSSTRRFAMTSGAKAPYSPAYCVVAKESVPKNVSVAFLERLKDDFMKNGGGKADTALAKSLNKEYGPVIKQHIIDHSDEIDKTLKVQAQVSEVKNIMLENIEKTLGRGEKLSELQDKTSDLRTQAQEFEKQGVKIRRKTWLQNMKIKLVILGILLLLVLIVWVSVCQGFDCTKHGT